MNNLIRSNHRRLLFDRRPTDSFYLAEISGRSDCLFPLKHDMLGSHMAVLGKTRSGKSYFIESLLRQMIDQGAGFLFIDPHGSSANKTLAYCRRMLEIGTYNEYVLNRLHYLECGPERVFSLDPFATPEFHHPNASTQKVAIDSWLHATVDQFALAVQRMQGDDTFEGMARLERNLKNILIAVGTSIGPDGKHLPLSEVFTLLYFNHPNHGFIYDLVAPNLPDEVRLDFEREKDLPVRQQEDNLQSTIKQV